MSGTTLAAAPCHVCGLVFTFDPDRVPVVLIDPETGRPPDVDENLRTAEPDPAATARAVERPYCPRCAQALNDLAERTGRPRIFDETDTAALP